MDKKTVGLLGAVAGLATIGSAQAAINPAPNPPQALRASSYADLLAPIPNAAALLKADDAARTQAATEAAGGVRLTQYYYYSPYYYNPYYYNYPYSPYYYPPYYRRHFYYHHHHHHHNNRYHNHHAALFPVHAAGDALG